LLIWLTEPSDAIIILSLLLVSLWFAVKVPLNMAWLILSNRKLFKIKNRSRTFRHFRIWIILTGLLMLITALGHLLPFSLLSRQIIDTVFMLFLSWTFFPLLRLRHLMLEFFSRNMTGYWFLVLRLISLLVPLLLLTVSLLGLTGYINLGWYMARNLGLLILILTSWLIVRGLVNDILRYLKNLALKHSDYGLLWTQDLIPLIGNLINLAILIAAIMLYFFLSGWANDYAIMEAFNQALNYQLIHLGENEITVLLLLQALILLWFVFWFASWTRRITYRWIYLGISDLGVRLSLAVFTQYSLVVIGLLITLNIIGINLTTLTVFLGALGVGIGFGLQTIANNFISGLILLVERPLKTGDFVNIGTTCEGEVTNIGIRSTIVRQWNRQEVIVPNSEVITNAFTNWTHSDHILRTTLYVRTRYDTEPETVLNTLLDIFKDLPNVLTDPVPFVTLWEFGESWILFRVDYYINLRFADMFATRTQVGVAMWQALKAAGVQIAYPKQDIHVQSMPPAAMHWVTPSTSAKIVPDDLLDRLSPSPSR
jgi:potassium efflux system protein